MNATSDKLDQGREKPITLVVLGAGASYAATSHGARKSPPTQMPLTAELARRLGGQLANRFGGQNLGDTRLYVDRCDALLHRLEARRKSAEVNAESFNFELELAALAKATHEERAGEMLAFRFAIREFIAECSSHADSGSVTESLHGKMIASLKEGDGNREFLYLDLNYDTVAENALRPRSVADHPPDLDGWLGRRVTLLHPHGSIRWRRELKIDGELATIPGPNIRVDKGRVLDQLILSADRLSVGSRLPLSRVKPALPTSRVSESLWIPDLALPLAGQETTKTAWPTEQSEAADEMLPRVDRLIVIGWAAFDDDILGLLQKQLRWGELHSWRLSNTTRLRQRTCCAE